MIYVSGYLPPQFGNSLIIDKNDDINYLYSNTNSIVPSGSIEITFKIKVNNIDLYLGVGVNTNRQSFYFTTQLDNNKLIEWKEDIPCTLPTQSPQENFGDLGRCFKIQYLIPPISIQIRNNLDQNMIYVNGYLPPFLGNSLIIPPGGINYLYSNALIFQPIGEIKNVFKIKVDNTDVFVGVGISDTGYSFSFNGDNPKIKWLSLSSSPSYTCSLGLGFGANGRCFELNYV